MAEKSFAAKKIKLDGSGTPTIQSPGNLNLNAVNVAISTDVSIGGQSVVNGDLDIAADIRHIGDTDTRLRFETDTISARTSGSERIRITSDGDMGLGASNPGADPAIGNDATVFEIRQTTTGNITSGNNRKGAVLRLKHEAQWENGYQSSSPNDDLGRVEFVTGDNSTAEGVRAAIRCRNLTYFNNHDLTFEVAAANSTSLTERLRITSDGYLKHTGLRSGNSQNKLAILVTPSYNTGEEDVIVYQAENESGSNQLSFGGGTGSYNAATTLRFLTAAVNTTGGNERLRITSEGRFQYYSSAGSFSSFRESFKSAAVSNGGTFTAQTHNCHACGTVTITSNLDGSSNNKRCRQYPISLNSTSNANLGSALFTIDGSSGQDFSVAGASKGITVTNTSGNTVYITVTFDITGSV